MDGKRTDPGPPPPDADLAQRLLERGFYLFGPARPPSETGGPVSPGK